MSRSNQHLVPTGSGDLQNPNQHFLDLARDQHTVDERDTLIRYKGLAMQREAYLNQKIQDLELEVQTLRHQRYLESARSAAPTATTDEPVSVQPEVVSIPEGHPTEEVQSIDAVAQRELVDDLIQQVQSLEEKNTSLSGELTEATSELDFYRTECRLRSEVDPSLERHCSLATKELSERQVKSIDEFIELGLPAEEDEPVGDSAEDDALFEDAKEGQLISQKVKMPQQQSSSQIQNLDKLSVAMSSRGLQIDAAGSETQRSSPPPPTPRQPPPPPPPPPPTRQPLTRQTPTQQPASQHPTPQQPTPQQPRPPRPTKNPRTGRAPKPRPGYG